jgi:hypothetical protein
MRRRLVNSGSAKSLIPNLKMAKPEKPKPVYVPKPLEEENSKQEAHQSLKEWLDVLPDVGRTMPFRDMMRVYVTPHTNNRVDLDGFPVYVVPTHRSIGVMEEGMIEITGISIHYTVNEVPSGPVGVIRVPKDEWIEKIEDFHNDRVIERGFTARA